MVNIMWLACGRWQQTTYPRVTMNLSIQYVNQVCQNSDLSNSYPT